MTSEAHRSARRPTGRAGGSGDRWRRAVQGGAPVDWLIPRQSGYGWMNGRSSFDYARMSIKSIAASKPAPSRVRVLRAPQQPFGFAPMAVPHATPGSRGLAPTRCRAHPVPRERASARESEAVKRRGIRVREDWAMANRLAQTTSPYLLQHADNPVDWWPWSPEAFEEARGEVFPCCSASATPAVTGAT